MNKKERMRLDKQPNTPFGINKVPVAGTSANGDAAIIDQFEQLIRADLIGANRGFNLRMSTTFGDEPGIGDM